MGTRSYILQFLKMYILSVSLQQYTKALCWTGCLELCDSVGVLWTGYTDNIPVQLLQLYCNINFKWREKLNFIWTQCNTSAVIKVVTYTNYLRKLAKMLTHTALQSHCLRTNIYTLHIWVEIDNFNANRDYKDYATFWFHYLGIRDQCFFYIGTLHKTNKFIIIRNNYNLHT